MGVFAGALDTAAHIASPPHHFNATAAIHRLSSVCSSSPPSCALQTAAVCEVEACHEWITPLIFPFLALSIGCALKPFTRYIKVPYTLLLLASGIVVGLLGCARDLGYLTFSLQQWVHLSPPDVFFYVFLAPLIFEAAFNTKWHIFRRLLIPILTAAFAIVLAQTALIAGFTRGVVGKENGWESWWPALMFGAMLSATDPISVTATLKALGASENLGTLIEGESLVNDGSAFVLWEAFFHNAQHVGDELQQYSPSGIFALVLKSSVGGALLGVLFALVTLALLSFIYDEFEVETSLTVVVAFLGFWTAQSPAHLSGVIANVSSGLVLSAYGRPLITTSLRHPLAEFWELLGWIANTIVFVHSGVLTVAFVWPCSAHEMRRNDYLLIFGFFCYLQVIRVLLFAIAHPVLSWKNKWLTWRQNLVTGMSGLRGAVSLILALNVAGADSISEKVRSRIVLWTTGIVILSLVVNGLLIKPLLKLLGLEKLENTREAFYDRARASTVQATLSTLDTLCVDIGFRAARWSYVVSNVLPKHWLEKDDMGLDYAEDVETTQTRGNERASLDVFYDKLAIETARRSMAASFDESRRMSLVLDRPRAAIPRSSTQISFVETELQRISFSRDRPVSSTGVLPQLVKRYSLGDRALRSPGLSAEFSRRHRSIDKPATKNERLQSHMRRSLDLDLSRYAHGAAKEAKTDVSGDTWPHPIDDEPWGEDEPRDREVRRRVLMSMLAHVRALSNSTLIEYSALINLEEDIQSALDANDEGRDYNLFSQLSRRSMPSRVLSKLNSVVKKKLSGEEIVVLSVLFSVLSEILKQPILSESPKVRKETETIYETALHKVNMLEKINPKGLRWVHSQFAIHVTVSKQDAALDEMRASGVMDEYEYKLLREELVQVRRMHSTRARTLWRTQTLSAKDLLAYHPMFADWRHFGKAPSGFSFPSRNLIPNQHSGVIIVLQGAMHSVEEDPEFGKTSQSSLTRTQDKPKAIGHSGNTSLPCHSHQHHWCFYSSNSVCSPRLACSINNAPRGEECSTASERLSDTHYIGCSNIDGTEVAFLSEKEVREKARKSKVFRDETTRAYARQIVLQSVADQETHHLRVINEALANKLDEQSVIGRAFRILERLPYMTVVRIQKNLGDRGVDGEPIVRSLQGPGVLLNGVVRMSILDTSGLVGAVNLLVHERLEGPALLPAGELILEEVQGMELEKTQSDVFMKDMFGDADAEEMVDMGKTREQKESGPVLAHILVDDRTGLRQSARDRLQRWNAHSNTVDMNGRFGMFRHVAHCAYGRTTSKTKSPKGVAGRHSSSKNGRAEEFV